MQMGPGMMGGSLGGAPWVINGRPFDPKRVDAQPRLGSVEVWRFANTSTMMHPVHTHDVMFQILDRDGRRPAAEEAGWKDTVHVGVGETVRLITRFADDRGMMSPFRVV